MSSLVELTPRLGGLCWVSRSLFEIEGRWADTMGPARATIHLATSSRHHGWHATLWSDSLPDSPALDAESHIKPPSPGWQNSVAAIDAVAGDDDTGRLAALYRVLVPRLMFEIAAVDRMLGGPADVHLARIVGLVSTDVTADLVGGLDLLTTTLGDSAAINRASVTSQALDQAFQN
ncbi:MAG: hypothetical protein ACR2PK_03480 [Acidimicrobiales bacterium]